jgi:outer membrane receptor protein involved in Fe transport
MNRFVTTRVWVMLLAVVLVLPVVMYGQEVTGSIAGTVYDPSGAVVPSATIEVSGSNLPRPLSTTSDSNGNYTFPRLPAGSYTVKATAPGFSAVNQIGINVTLGRIARIDFKLAVGTVAETVTVSAAAIMVDTLSSASAVTIDKSFFDNLPKGRGFYDLIGIAPGARNEGKAGGYQIDGASGSENIYYLDGMEITNVQTGVLSGQNRIPVEAVQQVEVKNGVMDAQYGGAMGGVVNAVVRTGTNSFHGQAGFYFNNDSMSARPRPTLEMDPTDATRTKYRYFQNTMDDYSTWNPVFNVGGPILKDKLFFFSGFMPTRTITNRTVTFLSNNQTQDFSTKNVQHYVVNKVDYALFSKIRMNMSWIWNPSYVRGNLPARQGTDAPDREWSKFGEYRASNILTGQMDFIATNKLIFSFRGGYNFSNYKNGYALSSLTHIYSSANTMFTNLPPSVPRLTAAGWVQQGTAQTRFDNYNRVNLSADGSYLANWKGQHNLKFGWTTNRLSNSVNTLSYPYGYYRFYWDVSYTCITSQCSGKQRGTYGYYRWYTYGTLGDASSDNQGLYFQDSWHVNKHVTLNLGLRAEREFLPSFSKQGIAAAPPIEFGWGKKISPRLGIAWDPKGDGKMRIYGSWGDFYDVMKYEMPRGSFGGDIYLTYYYALDDPTVFNTLKTYGYPSDPSKLPGRFFEGVNWRIPSNDPSDPTVDPDLKPMKQRMVDVGFEYSLTPSLAVSARYTNRRLIRTIEDVGTLGAAGEIYYIANPGFGLVADPKTWDPGFPTTPKAVRHYDAIEFRLDQRFKSNYQFAASYTWSRQYGNYSGLASSDENGRTSPNVNRYFDLPWLAYTEQGKMAEGRLATDRPHTLKFFGAYSLKSMLGSTTFSPSMQLWSGAPLTSEINAISSVPLYPYGRGDLGRTPTFFSSDFNVMHDFRPFKNSDTLKLRFELTVFNLFNSSIVTNKDQILIHPDDGQLTFANDADVFKGYNTKALMTAQGNRFSPTYSLASGFQGPRSVRLQLTFFF